MMACLNDEVSAHRYVESKLWPNSPVCPRCGVRGRVDKVDGAATRIGVHKCHTCRRSFSITEGPFSKGGACLVDSSHSYARNFLASVCLAAAIVWWI